MSKKKSNQKQNPYHVDKFATIPAWFKIEFLKFWIAGASFYLMVFGLPSRFDYLDRMVLLTLILTIGIEYISQTVIKWMANDKDDTSFYLIHEINRKSILSLLATLFYVSIIVVLSQLIIAGWIALGLTTIGDWISESTLDPFSFAILYMIFDTAWIYARRWYKTWRNKKGDQTHHEEHI
jgi:hypothetical protein